MWLAATKMRVARLPSEIHLLVRTELLLAASICLATANAQLINGSFENGSDGWTVPCDCAPVYPTPGGAPGGGAQCLGLDNLNFDCLCMVVNATQQITPWITPGPWVLSGWIKSAVPGDIPGSFIRVSEGPAFSSSILSNLASSTGDWEFVADTFVVASWVETDSLRVSLVPDDGNEQPPAICYFDGIQLTSLLSTAIDDKVTQPVAFRPNPATDHLWIDLPDAVKGITMIDATGRQVPLLTFHHTGRTLEVDVSSVPPGLCVMLLSTPSGLVPVRFLKA